MRGMPIIEERELHVQSVAADAASDAVGTWRRFGGQHDVGERLVGRADERGDRAAPPDANARHRRRRCSAGRRARGAEQRGQERLEHRLAHGGGEQH